MKQTLCVLFISFSFILQAQNEYAIANIPAELKRDANSVIQSHTTDVEIISANEFGLTYEIVISVLNKNGNSHISPYVHYDKVTKVKRVEALVYDEKGEEIKKFRKKDFLDLSAVDGYTLYSDDRLLYFDHTPSSYPYTIAFTYTLESENTAFIRPFYPISDYNSSVMQSSYNVRYAPGVALKHKELDTDGVIAVSEVENAISFSVNNLKAMNREALSPKLDEFLPHVMFSLDTFYLEGVRGIGTNWDQFGKWMHHSLLKDVSEVPYGTQEKVRGLVAGESTIEGKARKVYEYVQQNTRYISVQIGIGGWKPMSATDVDKVGYGDCKALTNYTKALLEVAEVPSYYTVVYAGSEKKDILSDFASLQGNHVILAVPNEDETIWLECTSQDIPFGFLGSFTDDRDVLMVTPEGGKISHTQSYGFESNKLTTIGNCKISEEGDIDVEVSLESVGLQYDDRYFISTRKNDEQEKFYKNYWRYIDNISMNSMAFDNDKEAVKLKEKLNFNARAYTSFAGDNILFNVNVLNRSSFIPKRYKNRKRPLQISRGFVDSDKVSIEIPAGYHIEKLPDPISLQSKFGQYTSEIQRGDGDGKLIYLRRFELYEGVFPKEEYENYRKFRKDVAKNDNQKLILAKR